jgi:hypothetical protein
MKKIFVVLLLMSLIFSCEEDSTSPEQTDKPIVEIINPENNFAFSDSLLIKVTATDDKGVVQVEIYIDNVTNNLRTFYVDPYEYWWVPPVEQDSSIHIIYAKAYDGDENMTSTKVVNVYHINLPPPTNLSVVSLSETSLQLNWDNSLLHVEGFIIERKPRYSNLPFEKIGETYSPYFTDNNLSKDLEYLYKVRAYRGSDTTGYSNEISVHYITTFLNSKYFNRYGGDPNIKTPLAMQINDYNYWTLYSFQNTSYFNYYNISTTTEGNYSLSSPENKIKNIIIHSSGRILFASSTGKAFGRKYPGFAYYEEFLLSNQPLTDVIFLDNSSVFASAAQDGEIKIVNYDQSQVISSYYNVVSDGEVLLAFDDHNNILISTSEAGYMTPVSYTL